MTYCGTAQRDVRRRFLDAAFAHMDAYFPGWRRSPAVKAVAGRFARRVVTTNRVLLGAYVALNAKERR